MVLIVALNDSLSWIEARRGENIAGLLFDIADRNNLNYRHSQKSPHVESSLSTDADTSHYYAITGRYCSCFSK